MFEEFFYKFWGMFESRVLILLYHRVIELTLDPQLLSVSPQNFSEHLEVLQKYMKPMKLQDLVQGLQNGKLPHRAVVVTFDDGYADNFQYANPLLEKYEIPATVFVTAGYVGKDEELWWDELEKLILKPGDLPGKLILKINGSSQEWGLGESANYSKEAFERDRAWNVLINDDPTPRHKLYRLLFKLMRSLDNQGRTNILEQLRKYSGNGVLGRATHRILSHDELIQLEKGGWVEIGAHCLTHPVLSSLPLAKQEEEIRGSKSLIEGILGHSVSGFAYPYGTRNDYTAETVSLVREAGYDYACSNFSGIATKSMDRYQMPRFLVRNWDADEFEKHMEEWFFDG